MKLFIKIYLFVFSFDSFGWTTTYIKKLNFDNLVNTSQLKFSKKTPLFTQLVFSFNSLRPSKGKFTFFVQAFVSGRGWTPLYKAMEWGDGVQQTFLSEPENVVDHLHAHGVQILRLLIEQRQPLESFLASVALVRLSGIDGALG